MDVPDSLSANDSEIEETMGSMLSASDSNDPQISDNSTVNNITEKPNLTAQNVEVNELETSDENLPDNGVADNMTSYTETLSEQDINLIIMGRPASISTAKDTLEIPPISSQIEEHEELWLGDNTRQLVKVDTDEDFEVIVKSLETAIDETERYDEGPVLNPNEGPILSTSLETSTSSSLEDIPSSLLTSPVTELPLQAVQEIEDIGISSKIPVYDEFATLSESKIESFDEQSSSFFEAIEPEIDIPEVEPSLLAIQEATLPTDISGDYQRNIEIQIVDPEVGEEEDSTELIFTENKTDIQEENITQSSEVSVSSTLADISRTRDAEKFVTGEHSITDTPFIKIMRHDEQGEELDKIWKASNSPKLTERCVSKESSVPDTAFGANEVISEKNVPNESELNEEIKTSPTEEHAEEKIIVESKITDKILSTKVIEELQTIDGKIEDSQGHGVAEKSVIAETKITGENMINKTEKNEEGIEDLKFAEKCVTEPKTEDIICRGNEVEEDILNKVCEEIFLPEEALVEVQKTEDKKLINQNLLNEISETDQEVVEELCVKRNVYRVGEELEDYVPKIGEEDIVTQINLNVDSEKLHVQQEAQILAEFENETGKNLSSELDKICEDNRHVDFSLKVSREETSSVTSSIVAESSEEDEESLIGIIPKELSLKERNKITVDTVSKTRIEIESKIKNDAAIEENIEAQLKSINEETLLKSNEDIDNIANDVINSKIQSEFKLNVEQTKIEEKCTDDTVIGECVTEDNQEELEKHEFCGEMKHETKQIIKNISEDEPSLIPTEKYIEQAENKNCDVILNVIGDQKEKYVSFEEKKTDSDGKIVSDKSSIEFIFKKSVTEISKEDIIDVSVDKSKITGVESSRMQKSGIESEIDAIKSSQKDILLKSDELPLQGKKTDDKSPVKRKSEIDKGEQSPPKKIKLVREKLSKSTRVDPPKNIKYFEPEKIIPPEKISETEKSTQSEKTIRPEKMIQPEQIVPAEKIPAIEVKIDSVEKTSDSDQKIVESSIVEDKESIEQILEKLEDPADKISSPVKPQKLKLKRSYKLPQKTTKPETVDTKIQTATLAQKSQIVKNVDSKIPEKMSKIVTKEIKIIQDKPKSKETLASTSVDTKTAVALKVTKTDDAKFELEVKPNIKFDHPGGRISVSGSEQSKIKIAAIMTSSQKEKSEFIKEIPAEKNISVETDHSTAEKVAKTDTLPEEISNEKSMTETESNIESKTIEANGSPQVSKNENTMDKNIAELLVDAEKLIDVKMQNTDISNVVKKTEEHDTNIINLEIVGNSQINLDSSEDKIYLDTSADTKIDFDSWDNTNINLGIQKESDKVEEVVDFPEGMKSDEPVLSAINLDTSAGTKIDLDISDDTKINLTVQKESDKVEEVIDFLQAVKSDETEFPVINLDTSADTKVEDSLDDSTINLKIQKESDKVEVIDVLEGIKYDQTDLSTINLDTSANTKICLDSLDDTNINLGIQKESDNVEEVVDFPEGMKSDEPVLSAINLDTSAGVKIDLDISDDTKINLKVQKESDKVEEAVKSDETEFPVINLDTSADTKVEDSLDDSIINLKIQKESDKVEVIDVLEGMKYDKTDLSTINLDTSANTKICLDSLDDTKINLKIQKETDKVEVIDFFEGMKSDETDLSTINLGTSAEAKINLDISDDTEINLEIQKEFHKVDSLQEMKSDETGFPTINLDNFADSKIDLDDSKIILEIQKESDEIEEVIDSLPKVKPGETDFSAMNLDASIDNKIDLDRLYDIKINFEIQKEFGKVDEVVDLLEEMKSGETDFSGINLDTSTDTKRYLDGSDDTKINLEIQKKSDKVEEEVDFLQEIESVETDFSASVENFEIISESREKMEVSKEIVKNIDESKEVKLLSVESQKDISTHTKLKFGLESFLDDTHVKIDSIHSEKLEKKPEITPSSREDKIVEEQNEIIEIESDTESEEMIEFENKVTIEKTEDKLEVESVVEKAENVYKPREKIQKIKLGSVKDDSSISRPTKKDELIKLDTQFPLLAHRLQEKLEPKIRKTEEAKIVPTFSSKTETNKRLKEQLIEKSNRKLLSSANVGTKNTDTIEKRSEISVSGHLATMESATRIKITKRKLNTPEPFITRSVTKPLSVQIDDIEGQVSEQSHSCGSVGHADLENIPKFVIKSLYQPEGRSSPKITIKPIKPPEETAIKTRSSEESSHSPKITIKPIVKPDPLKFTITKQKSDDTHSILKIYQPEEQVPEQSIPKLTIKPIQKTDEMQHSPKISIKSTKPSTSSSISPKITVKPIPSPNEHVEITHSPKISVKSEENYPRVTIKPVLRPEDQVPQLSPRQTKLKSMSFESSSGVTVEPVCMQKLEPENQSNLLKISVKPFAKIEESLSPKLTIKPITKTCEIVQSEDGTSSPLKLTIKPILKPEETAYQSPKITIKPIVKPDEVQISEELDKPERIILKIQKNNLPSPKERLKEAKKEPEVKIEPVPQESDKKLNKIKLKLTKEGSHAQIIPSSNTFSLKRSLELSESNLFEKRSKTEFPGTEILHTSDISINIVEPNTRPCPKTISEEVTIMKIDKAGGSQESISEQQISQSKFKEMLMKMQQRSEITCTRQIEEEYSSSSDDVKIVEVTENSPMKDPITMQEETSSQDVMIISETIDPFQSMNVLSPYSTTPQMPKKRGRPRKNPLEVKPEIKDEDCVEVEQLRPKRTCRAPAGRTPFAVKERKPRGAGRGRGGSRGRGGAKSQKTPKEPKPSPRSKALKEAKALAKIEAAKLAQEVVIDEITIEDSTNDTPAATPLPPADESPKKPEVPEIPEIKEVVPSPLPQMVEPEVKVSAIIEESPKQPQQTPPPAVYEEETRMSADNSSRAQTPAPQVFIAPSAEGPEESQSSVQSTATTESSKTKKGRLEFIDPDSAVTTVDQIVEYPWNNGGPYMLQEQIAQFLGVKSFKRKYPGLTRRFVEMQERDYIREKGLVSESMCDMGLTAVPSTEILDIMYSDFQEKYEEYRKYLRDKQAKEISSKQKAVSLATSQEKNKIDFKERAVRSAASWNLNFNKTRKESRKCCMDLQTFTINYPAGKIKVPHKAPVGHYPLALVPGQYTDYYKSYKPHELNYLPLNTVRYGPVIPNQRCEPSQSDGSQSDTDSSSGSDSDSSDESMSTEEETSQVALKPVEIQLTQLITPKSRVQ